jgi:hypothetical protein
VILSKAIIFALADKSALPFTLPLSQMETLIHSPTRAMAITIK